MPLEKNKEGGGGRTFTFTILVLWLFHLRKNSLGRFEVTFPKIVINLSMSFKKPSLQRERHLITI